MSLLKLGTRGSALALTQSKWVAAQLCRANAGLEVEIVIIKTSGDKDQNSALNKFAGKGIFTKEIEDALLAGDIDLAVHSLKDLPTELPAGLSLAPPPEREDPRDLLVAKCSVQELPQGTLVGTGSARRREQLRELRPDLRFEEIRGNVNTRVKKWRDGLYGATVLACAGVARLGSDTAGLQEGESYPLSIQDCLPAPCQGLLGLEYRTDDQETARYLETISDPDSIVAFKAERAFLAELDGGCHIPAACLATVREKNVQVEGYLSQTDEHGQQSSQRIVLDGPIEDAESLGRAVAQALK